MTISLELWGCNHGIPRLMSSNLQGDSSLAVIETRDRGDLCDHFSPYLCSMFAGGRDRQRQRAFANLFEILSQRRAVFVSVFPLILWPTGSETDHSPQPLQVKMEPIMRAPFGEVVLPITELIRVGAKVEGTSFPSNEMGLRGTRSS